MFNVECGLQRREKSLKFSSSKYEVKTAVKTKLSDATNLKGKRTYLTNPPNLELGIGSLNARDLRG